MNTTLLHQQDEKKAEVEIFGAKKADVSFSLQPLYDKNLYQRILGFLLSPRAAGSMFYSLSKCVNP